ncbi:replication initiation protein [Arcicella rigui]|uniref:Replication initiation protein n=1 Tax=Arcicella rigui TaxID=797020 RepID=A0ABU5QFT4_9BACT|nr:replication initiation protein [Arcicella rigui]MEA5141144.1 replication initiation protein [Arcicella rigui]
MKKKKNDSDSSQSVKLIRKSNNLVEGKYRFDIWEMRVFTKMLTMIFPDDEDFKEYRIYLKDVIEDFNLTTDRQAYNLLKGGAVKLMKKEIKIVRDTDEGEKEFLTHIAVGLDSFTSKSQGSYIDISFHPKMKPFLLQLQSQFLMYDVRNVLQLQSSFSVRIYELLKQYEKIGKRIFTLTELKDTLAVADKYPLYANFKQRVILKAQEDLENYTDIRFTFEEDKRGKAVHSIIFNIYSNKTVVEERKQPESNENDVNEEMSKVYDAIKTWEGINLKTINEWLEKYSPDYVLERIETVKKQQANGTKIKNLMGYLQKLMQQEVLFEIKPLANTKSSTDKKQQNLLQTTIEQEEKALESLRISYYENQNAIIEHFFNTNPTVKEHFIESIKLRVDYNKQLNIEENLQRPSFKAAINAKVKEMYPLLFKELDESFKQQETAIKQSLRALGWKG